MSAIHVIIILFFVFLAVLAAAILKLYGTVKAIDNYTISLSSRISKLEKQVRELSQKNEPDLDDLK